MNQNNSVRENILTVFFTVLIFLGIQFFRIPVPLAAETLFLHFAHIFVVLALTCLDLVKATVAALLGFLAFEVLNGNYSAIPSVLFITIVSCLATGTVYSLWMDQDNMTRRDEYEVAVKSVLLYGALNLLANMAWNSWSTMMAGSAAGAAVLTAITSALPIAINSVFTILGTSVLYLPVHTVCKRIVNG